MSVFLSSHGRFTLLLCLLSLSYVSGLVAADLGKEAWEGIGLYHRDAPRPPQATAIRDTKLPLEWSPSRRVALVGNTLFERMGLFGYFEAYLQASFPLEETSLRNLAWSADTVDLQPRPDNFADLHQHLYHERIDLVLLAFGFNESFAGEAGLPAFETNLREFVLNLKSQAFDGEASPQVVIISPIACEDIPGVAAYTLNHPQLLRYTQSMRDLAEELEVAFVDVLSSSAQWLSETSWQGTINGIHLNKAGYERLAADLYRGLFFREPPPLNEALRLAVVEKNEQYFRRYRPLNTYYYTGARNAAYGYLDFLPAMKNFDQMVSNRDQWVWDLAKGEVRPEPDDTNLIPLPKTPQPRNANQWLEAEEELKAFEVDPRFEINLFASEETFPDLACPIQMRWDQRGRLWVSCSTTYPHVYPGQKPRDKIIILEDTDWDGRADSCQVFAEDLHIPLSFELAPGGVYVSEEPYLSWLEDTDGDDRADKRTRLLAGFGCEDSHHALHDMVWTPDGDLMFRESIFHHSQIETPYGPIRTDNSAWFLFRPEEHRLSSFGSYPNTNPWGVTFDDWGYHVASHPIFASVFHAPNPPYPQQHARAAGIPAYSGVCGHEFVDFDGWPDTMQGGFVKVRYKPTNRVEIHQWVEKSDHFEEVYQGNLLHATNLSFIPTDLKYGPRGAMYICDWYNPVKGHAQYSLRDERRDRRSGRIWRVMPKGMSQMDPPPMANASLDQLLDNLERREYRYRYWSKRMLRSHDPKDVRLALMKWVSQLDKGDPRWNHHLCEALWVARSIGWRHEDWLRQLLKNPYHHARAVAARMLRHWHDTMPDALDWLKLAAEDQSDFVRMEAAISASWMGSRQALDILMSMVDRPMGAHMRYAFVSSLNAATMRAHWEGNPTLASVPQLLELAKDTESFMEPSPSASEAAFDNQPGLITQRISCIPEQMRFTVERMEATAGQPIKIILTNPDATDHNWVLVNPGSVQAVGTAANAMAREAANANSDFIPADHAGHILAHTPMIGPGRDTRVGVVRFHAPKGPGHYPFICTFPGHWLIMQGVLVVTEGKP